MIFTSDNAVGAAPEMLDALARANAGWTGGYGADDHTEAMKARVAEVFGKPAAVYLVATGTAANALSLATLCPPWGAVYCHRAAHVEVDECGAPEFFTGGAKLALIDGAGARIPAETLAEVMGSAAAGGVHQVQRGALSLTQATELGQIYTVEEVRALADIAHGHGVGVHMDGTRFANAVARLGCEPADLTWRAGVDILCLGATKNGALAAEAVLIFDEARAWEFELRRKRAGHLWSKMRFLSAQIDAYLTDGLWLRLAAHANAMADRLAGGLREIEGVSVNNQIEANMIFATLPRAAHNALAAAGARYYPWPEAQAADADPISIRLVCSFATEEAEVDRFLEIASSAVR